jgi:DNA topoisomerase-1
VAADIDATSDVLCHDVLYKITDVLAPHVDPAREDGGDPRQGQTCGTGSQALRTARSGGAFIGCSNYPECRYTRPLAGDAADGDLGHPDGRLLGQDEAGLPISLRKGPYGLYVQRGEAAEGVKPPRTSIPKGMDPEALDLSRALELLSLPRLVGTHPDDGAPVEAGIGRFGPFVKHGKVFANIKDPEEVLTIGMNRAMEVLAQKAARGAGRTAVAALRELGEHPDGGPVAVFSGRYGPYVKWEKVNATLPKEVTADAVTMEQALQLIAAKRPAKRKGAAAQKAPAKAAKKAPARKTAPKKTAAE